MVEEAFANAMAVNRFEVMRYIIPYRNTSDPTQQTISDNAVMNFIADTVTNKDAYIFGGISVTRRDGQHGSDPENVPFGGSDTGGINNIVKNETDEIFGVSAAGDIFPETYTAWRFGSRGYRVKLVNIQDLLTLSNQDFQNPLSSSYTLPDQDVTVDLSKIKY
jgi:hypothetical protein